MDRVKKEIDEHKLKTAIGDFRRTVDLTDLPQYPVKIAKIELNTHPDLYRYPYGSDGIPMVNGWDFYVDICGIKAGSLNFSMTECYGVQYNSKKSDGIVKDIYEYSVYKDRGDIVNHFRAYFSNRKYRVDLDYSSAKRLEAIVKKIINPNEIIRFIKETELNEVCV